MIRFPLGSSFPWDCLVFPENNIPASCLEVVRERGALGERGTSPFTHILMKNLIHHFISLNCPCSAFKDSLKFLGLSGILEDELCGFSWASSSATLAVSALSILSLVY